ncbi:MAG TPA: hypothetical protein VH500_16345 [Nitrososphaeraceae archaeon]|jgi:hypothetical protein
MKTIGIDQDKICLIGHSLVGRVGAEIAIENEQLVYRLELIDSSGILNGLTALLEQYLHTALYPSSDKVRNVHRTLISKPLTFQYL